MFITFEGPDFSGKSTLSQRIYQNLLKKGYSVILCRDPGGTPVSEAIRTIVKNPPGKIDPKTHLLLFFASRKQLQEEIIKPHLAQGNSIVLCDRWLDSTRINNGLLYDIDQEIISNMARDMRIISADHTIHLTLSEDESNKRRALRDDDIDFFESRELRDKVRRLFNYLPELIQDLNYDGDKNRTVTTIDADKSAEAVFKEAMERIEAVIEQQLKSSVAN